MTAEGHSPMFKCNHCTKEFKYESERKRHEISHVPCFECDTCSKKFSFISALRRHKKQHNRTGSVKCEECGRKFRDEILLKRHVNYAHKGTYLCTKCDASFSSELALRTHTKTHKPVSDRKYRCKYDLCGKSFNFSHHLKHHELTHTNEKQHYCNMCGRGFIQQHHLKTHLKTHDPEKLLHCKEFDCRKKFTTEYARKRHQDSHSATICAICGKTVLKKQYEIHKSKCVVAKEKSNNIIDLSKTSVLNKGNGINEDPVTKPNIDNDLSNCKTALGGCIKSEEFDKNCLCTEMAKPVDVQYDFTPIGVIHVCDSLSAKSDLKRFDIKKNMCEGYKCASSCKSYKKEVTKDGCSKRITVNSYAIDAMPKIENRNDGIVKIENTYDLDIVWTNNVKEERIEKEQISKEIKVPFNSCKDVLGNCIVSGNGTMGEGCLCARMIDDEQQLMAQEIEDITPHPT